MIGAALGLVVLACLIALMRWLTVDASASGPVSTEFLPLGPRGAADQPRPAFQPAAPTLSLTPESTASACR